MRPTYFPLIDNPKQPYGTEQILESSAKKS